MANQLNRTQQLAADEKMIEGVQTVLATFASLPVGSQTVTPADIVKVLQARRSAALAADTARAALAAAVKVDRDTHERYPCGPRCGASCRECSRSLLTRSRLRPDRC